MSRKRAITTFLSQKRAIRTFFVAKMRNYDIFVAKTRNYDIFVAKIYDYALIDSFWGFPRFIDSPTSYATLLHTVLFVQYVCLPTEQSETYLKFVLFMSWYTCWYILIYMLIYIDIYIIQQILVGWKENSIFKETVTSKLKIWDFRVIFTDFECSKNNVSSAGKWKAKQVLELSPLNNIGKIASKKFFPIRKCIFGFQL